MEVRELTDQTLSSDFANQPKVILKFYATWCGMCRLIAPKFKKLSLDERFADVSFFDVNAEENPTLRELAGVSNLPFFATFENGELKQAQPSSKIESVESMLGEL